MNKEYTITSIKETIKNMLLEDAEVTKILLHGKDNTYKNVKELFNFNIFDYPRNRDLDNCTSCTTYIDFEVSKNHSRHMAFIVIKMHKDIIYRNNHPERKPKEPYHTDNDGINYLDLLAERIVTNITDLFGDDVKGSNISNKVVSRIDNFAERVITFLL